MLRTTARYVTEIIVGRSDERIAKRGLVLADDLEDATVAVWIEWVLLGHTTMHGPVIEAAAQQTG